MKAMIFAAGLGTRLRPFTNEHPKALVPVNGMPMLQRVIEKLKRCGITEVVVNAHHFASQIADFLHDNGNFGLHIIISDETSELLDTGGGILKAAKRLDNGEPVLVHNADILTDFDIKPMLEAHVRCNALATLLVAKRSTSRYLLFDDAGLMHGWTNVATDEVKPAGLDISSLSRRAFGGVHIISPAIFGMLEAYANGQSAFPIMPFYIQACQSAPIMSYEPAEAYHWYDIGKPETLAAAENAHIC